MSTFSFFWHDYETFGRVPRRDRPAQFAGVRTDAQLNEIDAPVMRFCKPAPDFLPDPEACLLTGILPQTCLQEGVPEHAFADLVEQQLGRPGTVGVGYNSMRFDDEVTRHLFWRNLIDPYAREWQNECGRWDLLDVVRCAYALRPDGIEWPQYADGKASFRLEDLTRVNGLAHDAAHDALSDVRATLALARLVKARQPKLWEFCLRLRRKEEVMKEMALAQSQGLPFLHVTGRFAAERGCIAIVWPLAPHPTHKNEVIVWDLAEDPAQIDTLNIESIRQRMFSTADELPAGVNRLPIKTIHINRSPVVISNLKTLSPAMAAKWGLDIERSLRHADVAAQKAHLLAGMWPAVFERPASQGKTDVDEDLYGGFLGNEDRRTLERLRGLAPEQLATKRPTFSDARLDELLFRYRARNLPETLSEAEAARWREHCVRRLHEGVHGGQTLQSFFDRINLLRQTADQQARGFLAMLADYARQIAPQGAGPHLS